jgi:NitT/TauT family transport system permease protein/sulfonate transport system permease protein
LTTDQAAALAALERRRRAAAHLFTLAALAAWALFAATQPAYVMPGPLDVAASLAGFLADPHMLRHMAQSLFHVGAAIVLSFALGAALALLAHYAPVFRLMVHGRITPFLNSFSGIGWTLLAVLWFGLNPTTVIFAICMVLTPFAIINLRAGLDTLDPELIEMTRSFGRKRVRAFRLVVLPSLQPFIFATLRISFGVSWKVALTAELFGGNAGFGYLFNLARQDYDTPLIFVVIVLIVAFVYAVDRFVFSAVQARLTRHYGSA